MKNQWLRFMLLLGMFLVSCQKLEPTPIEGLETPSLTATPRPQPTLTPSAEQVLAEADSEMAKQFVRASGQDLVVGEDETVIYLRGINFSNYLWNQDHDTLLAYQHHSKEDYAAVREMGMNVVRFNLSTSHFIDPANPEVMLDSGWAWMDERLEWAREAGVYLILNMHFAPGMSNDSDGSLWENKANRDVVTNVWRAIAERYAEEPIIAGYDLFNEPEPPEMALWEEWVDEMILAIRAVDPYHLIIVEGVNGIIDEEGNWHVVENPFFVVSDDNIMLDFHFYQPFAFTHQKMEWAGITELREYPNDSIILDWNAMQWHGAGLSDVLSAGTSDWAHYEGQMTPVMDETVRIGKPGPSCVGLQDGSAYYADFVVRAYDESGEYLEDAAALSIHQDQTWWIYSSDGSGSWTFSPDVPVEGVSRYSLAATGFGDQMTLSYGDLVFEVVPGQRYTISGWMRGETIPENAQCTFTLEFYGLENDAPLQQENRAYLAELIQERVHQAAELNRPLNLGEFGVNWYGWQEDRGADRWYRDVFEIAVENDLHFQSWAYHDIFGIYQGWDLLPVEHSDGQINHRMQETLIELFSSLPVSDE